MPTLPRNVEELRRLYMDISRGVGDVKIGGRSLQTLKKMLDAPGDTAVKSISMLAEEHGISTSSLTRLAQRLGYGGFPALQDIFRQEMRGRKNYYSDQVNRFLLTTGTTSPDVTGKQPLQHMVQSEWGNVMATMEECDATQYAQVAALVSRAPRVAVLGLRGSYTLAFYFGYYLRMIRDNVTIIDNGGNTLAEALADLDEGDLLFAISVKPYTKYTVDACRIAREQGLHVVAMTDSMASPLAYETDKLLVISSKGDFYFSPITSGVLYLEALLTDAVKILGDRAVDKLRNNERLLDRLGVETE